MSIFRLSLYRNRIFLSSRNKWLKSEEKSIRNDILFYNYNRTFPSSKQQHSWVLNEDSKWIYCPVHSLLRKRMSVDVCLLSYILGARSNLWPETCLFYERTYIHSSQVVPKPHCLHILLRNAYQILPEIAQWWFYFQTLYQNASKPKKYLSTYHSVIYSIITSN